MDRKNLTTLNASLEDDELMVVVTAATDFTQFHVAISSDKPMSYEDIADCLFNFADSIVEMGDEIFDNPDHVGEMN
jgi:hypothetical protein